MKVTIWHLDYYYNTNEKKHLFSTEAMKISAHHKQLGDSVNLVRIKEDIMRPFEIMYIIKDDVEMNTPIPMELLVDNRVRWYGAPYKNRGKWRITDEILGLRPDYLLYPLTVTKMGRAEHIRFFNDEGQPLKTIQNYTNSFKNKKLIIADKKFWDAEEKHIIVALDFLKNQSQLMFKEPINITKLTKQPAVLEAFLKLKLDPGADLRWTTVPLSLADAALTVLTAVKEANHRTFIGRLRTSYSDKTFLHWSKDNSKAKNDLANLTRIITRAKRLKIDIEIMRPEDRFETPYFYLFETISDWTISKTSRLSWLEYLTLRFHQVRGELSIRILGRPQKWNGLLKDLLHQTYKFEDFVVAEWGDRIMKVGSVVKENWKKEFKYEI